METIPEPFEYKGVNEVISKTFEGSLDFRHDPIIKITFRTSLLLILAEVIGLVLNIKNLPDKVPLFYSLPWGEDRLADSRFIFMLPLLSFFVMFLNLLIARRIYNNERLLARIIFSVGLVAALLCFVTLFQIIFIIS